MTGERFFRLTPTDTLFFRDGRPYNQDDDGLAHARSLFPPYPSTLTGALRAALALGGKEERQAVWTGRGDWPAVITAVLGDGPDMTGGRVRFGAPALLRRKDGRWEPLYPAPLCLVGREVGRSGADPVGWSDPALLRPGPALACSLGEAVRLPVCPPGEDGARRKLVADLWLTPAGLGRVLNGHPPPLDPAHVVHREDLWREEARVGLELAETTRTARRGRLYAPVHVRLAQDVALGQSVFGLPPDWQPVPVIALGGEHRSAWVETVDSPPPVCPPPPAFHPTDDGQRRCLTLILLSPARVPADWLRPGAVAGGAEIVSACLDRPIPIGGWDSRKGSTGPRALRGFLPAGCTWFLHVPENWVPPPLGEERDLRHGFGRFALGTFVDTGADSEGNKR